MTQSPDRVHTNGGTQLSTKIGTVKNFGNVCFNTVSLANILSMAEVRKVCRITMDTAYKAALLVHRCNGTIMNPKNTPPACTILTQECLWRYSLTLLALLKTTYFSTP